MQSVDVGGSFLLTADQYVTELRMLYPPSVVMAEVSFL